MPHVRRERAFPVGQALGAHGGEQAVVERGHAVVVEAAGDGAEDRHLLGRLVKRLPVPLHLFGDVAERVLAALAVELVDRDDVGEVEHVDLLELAGGAELGRHDVEREIRDVDDRGVALADAGGLDDHQVVAGGLRHPDRVRQRIGHLLARAAGRERAEVDVRVVDRVHADAVAQKRAAGPPPGRVDGDQRDAHLRPVEPEALHHLVGQGALARPARAGDAEDGDLARPCPCLDLAPEPVGQLARLGQRDQARDHPRMRGVERIQVGRRQLRQVLVGAAHHVGDHARQAELLAVIGAVDAGDAVVVQLADLLRHNGAAAAAEHLDMPGAQARKLVDHVFEILDVAALVARHRDAVGVLLDGGLDDLVHRPVVAQVDHLGAARLQDAPHDVDRRVMPVEQRRRCDEAEFVYRGVRPVRLFVRATASLLERGFVNHMYAVVRHRPLPLLARPPTGRRRLPHISLWIYHTAARHAQPDGFRAAFIRRMLCHEVYVYVNVKTRLCEAKYGPFSGDLCADSLT